MNRQQTRTSALLHARPGLLTPLG